MLKPIQRFALLLHILSDNRHWDLMLENGDGLATWRLPLDPFALATAATTDNVPAERIADHRLAYLTYEGPVSGERGEVRREDEGDYELLRSLPDVWLVRLAGRRLNGDFELPLQSSGGRFRRVGPARGAAIDRPEGPAAPA